MKVMSHIHAAELVGRGHGRSRGGLGARNDSEDGMKDRKREIGHRPAEECERVCIVLLRLKLRQLGVTGRYVSSVLA